MIKRLLSPPILILRCSLNQFHLKPTATLSSITKVSPSVIATSLIRNRGYSSHPFNKPTTDHNTPPPKKVTIKTLQNLYKDDVPITMMTAHDYPTGLWTEKARIDMCLVGDSLGMVALGYDSTSPVTLEVMIHHASAVSRAAKSPFLVVDLPFGSYECRPQFALENAIRLVKEANAEAVKLEGGREQAEVMKTITKAGIPVIGHIGLTPQKQVMLGGFRVQGKTSEKALEILDDALAIQEAGCSAIVLECVPAPIAEFITKQLHIPTIGIGSGAGCSGQVLVMLDTLGIYDKFVPKFCKQFGQLNNPALEALMEYKNEVKERRFPLESHCYPITDIELEKFKELATKKSIK